jgi:hypothetical protein
MLDAQRARPGYIVRSLSSDVSWAATFFFHISRSTSSGCFLQQNICIALQRLFVGNSHLLLLSVAFFAGASPEDSVKKTDSLAWITKLTRSQIYPQRLRARHSTPVRPFPTTSPIFPQSPNPRPGINIPVRPETIAGRASTIYIDHRSWTKTTTTARAASSLSCLCFTTLACFHHAPIASVLLSSLRKKGARRSYTADHEPRLPICLTGATLCPALYDELAGFNSSPSTPILRILGRSTVATLRL